MAQGDDRTGALPILGVDLGGTKVAAGLFDREGNLLGELATEPTEARGPPEGTLANIQRAIDRALAELAGSSPRPVPDAREGEGGAAVGGIGIGSTGPLDPAECRLLGADNLPRLAHFPLGSFLSSRYGLAVRMTNDANAFALAESLFGAGRGEGIVLGITIGTGCGCGIVIHGAILEGASANAGELYRALVGGARPGPGTFDEVISGPGLEAAFRRRAGREAGGAEIARLADGGDPDALGAFEEFGANVGDGLGILASVLDPGVIVLGGAVSDSLRHFEGPLRERFRQGIAPEASRRIRIARALLGARAGALGAAALFLSPATLR